MTPFPYRLVVRWSEPDDAWVAEVPAVRGAGGDGPTPEEAIRAAQESVQELLEVKKQHGDPVPPPDLEEPEFSGQIRLRMSKSLHRELAAAADREGVSLNHLMVEYLSMGVRTPSFTTACVTFNPLAFSDLPSLSIRFAEFAAEYPRANTPNVVDLHLPRTFTASAGTDKRLPQ